MRKDYANDVEGGAPVTLRFTIAGRLDVPAYLAFVAERAARLDVRGWAAPSGKGVTLVAAGPEALVGALEMACTLGPLEALVEQIDAIATTELVGPGFEVRPSGRRGQK